MKKIIASSIVALMLVGCGGGGSDGTSTITEDTTTSNTTDTTNNVQGTGTAQDPYLVGNGIYVFNDEAYYKVNLTVTSGVCNILAFNVINLDPFDNTQLFDESYVSTIAENSDWYTYTIDSSGNYIIKANAWTATNNGIGAVGIFSTCMTNDNVAPNVLNEGLNSFSGESMHLYKIDLAQNSNVTLNRVDNTDYVRFYNSDLENVYVGYGDTHSVDLAAGTNYVLVSSFYYTKEALFSVSITPY